MNPKPVFAIIVTHRRFEMFKHTVESLLPTLPEGSLLAIIDNASPELEYWPYLMNLPNTSPRAVEIRVLNLDLNYGWGAALNEGLRVFSDWKEYDYVLESNNDVEYEPDWFEKATPLMENYERIGVLGLWSHKNHGIKEKHPGLLVKDDMPATAWFFRSKDLQTFLPVPEKGPCTTRGGNGEDSKFVEKIKEMGLWAACPPLDLAHHLDGYDEGQLGNENPAYK